MLSTYSNLLLAIIAVSVLLAAAVEAAPAFRPPAVPLVTHTPYFSIWSQADKLTDCETTHWTGRAMPLRSIVRVDGLAYRLVGAEPKDVKPMEQLGLTLTPTSSTYKFANEQISVEVRFTTPALTDDLTVLSRPVTYISWTAESIDGHAHSVQVYLDEEASVAVNEPEQQVVFTSPKIAGLAAMKVGSSEQPVLAKSGDDLRIDWGYAYLCVPEEQEPWTAIGAGEQIRKAFVEHGRFPQLAAPAEPRKAGDGAFVMAAALDFGSVGKKAVTRWAMLAYDEIKSIRYIKDLKPYWTVADGSVEKMLVNAKAQYPALVKRCDKFDKALMSDVARQGGDKYERICSLAYRQMLAANVICDDGKGQPLMFSKENFSNGCIATVDVMYPETPFLLFFSPALMKASVTPILDYAKSPRWKFKFAPHDLGTYPHATGQVYGGGEATEENQMPVEETGNMLIMMAGLQQIAPDETFIEAYRPLLKQWADYLVEFGLDPANQLCTSDMFGHLAHNADLSVKAIIGIGCYAYLAEQLGDKAEAEHYKAISKDYAQKWVKLAADNKRTRLAFDQPDTWAMKHNLVWDRVLGLDLFPKSVGDAEVAWYKTVQGPYGLSCDNRTPQCLIDWAVWSISLADNPKDWEEMISPIYRYVNETPSRIPLSDWFDTKTGGAVGFRARSVVGGVYMKMLLDKAVWKKWARR